MTLQFGAEGTICGKQGWKVDKKHMHYATTYDRPLFSKTAGLVLVVTPISTINIAIIFLIDKRTQDMRTWQIL